MTRLEEIATSLAAVKAVIRGPPRSAKGAVAVILRGRSAVEVLVRATLCGRSTYGLALQRGYSLDRNRCSDCQKDDFVLVFRPKT